jgi:hypothetical protein
VVWVTFEELFKQNTCYVLELYRLIETPRADKMLTVFSVMLLYEAVKTTFRNIEDF